MAISFEGHLHYIKVYPGPDGKARFEQQIRELIQLDDDETFDVEFECKAPDSGTQQRCAYAHTSMLVRHRRSLHLSHAYLRTQTHTCAQAHLHT